MTDEWFDEWLEKAEEDYLAACALDAQQTPAPICFHCQQCVEKYLKAALVRQGLRVAKTHNIVVLNDILGERDPTYQSFVDTLDALSPYAVLSRYPGMEVSAQEAREALELTRALRERLRSLLGLSGAN